MKLQIKSYFESLKPKQLGLKKKIKVRSVKKLGMGAANANFLIVANNKKFVFRMNIETKYKNKSKKEYLGLKAVEKYGLAPKAWILDTSKKDFKDSFIILSYIEGRLCKKTKSFLTTKVIKELGRLLGKLHSIQIRGKIKNLPKESSITGFKSYLTSIKIGDYRYIIKKSKNKALLNILNETYSSLKSKLPKGKYKSNIVLSQGDFHTSNIIINKGKYKLIDFESLELTDEASHVAHIFMDFDKLFGKKQEYIFLQSYKKHFKNYDKNLKEKIEIWLPIKYFADFIWAVNHVLEIKNKDLHAYYIEKSDLQSHINYAVETFEICLREGIIDKKFRNFNLKRSLK